jgi:hypothetical protein
VRGSSGRADNPGRAAPETAAVFRGSVSPVFLNLVKEELYMRKSRA